MENSVDTKKNVLVKKKTKQGDGPLSRLKKWAEGNSLWGYPLINSCCSRAFVEECSPFAFVKFVNDFQTSPRHADLLILSGVLTEKQLPMIKEVYEQMLFPKWVMVIGTCAISGGPFNTYSVIQDIEKRIPVDVFIPGCPPSPIAICEGLELLKVKIKNTSQEETL